MMVILNKKRFLTLMVVFALIAIVDVFIITTRSSRAGGGNSGGSYVSGGNDGCSGEVNTCQGASWQYYSHDFSKSPTVTIPTYDSSFAPGATITGCGNADGYYRYAWAKYGNTSNQVGTAAVGSGGDYEETVFASIFFEYPMWIPSWGSYGDYCYALDYCNGPDNLYTGYDGNAMWYRGGMNYAQGWNHWNNVYNKFVEVSSTNNFKGNVRTWNRDSSLSWFCYWEDKKVTLSGIAIDESNNARIGDICGSNGRESCDPNSKTVKYDEDVEIVAKDIPNYEFQYWRTPLGGKVVGTRSNPTVTENAGYTYYADGKVLGMIRLWGSFVGDDSFRAVYKYKPPDYYETVVETEKGSYIESAGDEKFEIAGESFLNTITNAINTDGNNYNVKDGTKVEVGFRHELFQKPQTSFGADIDFWNDNNAFASGIMQVSNTTKKYTPKTQEISLALKANDDRTPACQNISFKSKTWRYQYLRKVETEISQEYRYHYNGEGEFLDKTKVGDPVTRIVSVGEPYLDDSSLAADGDSGDSIEACVYLYRPWNFKIDSISGQGDNGIAYAGDSFERSFTINVKKNDNNYAITDVPDVNISLCHGGSSGEGVCENIYNNVVISGGAGEIANNAGYVYSSYNKEGYTINTSRNITIDDLEAGAEYCIWLSVGPIDSGNGYYSSINGGTLSSSRQCYVIAKKPTFQVWGGNVYTAGDITAKTANKNIDGQARLFGSWVELGLTAGSSNNSLASGAALVGGFAGDALNTMGYSPLTITNNGAPGSGIRKSGDSRKDLVERFRNEYNTYNEDKVYNTSPEVNGVTLVAAADHNITISGNIENRDRTVSASGDVPVLIFYANNINIDCNVTRVDAILVAEGTIDTCYNPDGGDNNGAKNARNRSNQLMINGTVIADYLKLGRTYGAGVGTDSGIPAEIINASTDIYLREVMNDNANNSGAYTSYMRELAPRY